MKYLVNTIGNINISKRELQVLDLLSQGLSGREVAEMLFISTNTVKTHKSNLMLKLSSRNTAQLIRKGFEYGLLFKNNIISSVA